MKKNQNSVIIFQNGIIERLTYARLNCSHKGRSVHCEKKRSIGALIKRNN